MTAALATQPISPSAQPPDGTDTTLSSAEWLGRQIKAALYDLCRITIKIVAIAAVVVAHQYLPIAFQVSFWIGYGFMHLIMDKPFSQETFATISYGSSISWMMYAVKGINMCRVATSAAATASGVGLVA
ncbi:MAG TPA: hypothetical protein VN457_05890, partial [Chlamydiales bacterium]|nr:hypothetical protein [Chlamydiales bacterium]